MDCLRMLGRMVNAEDQDSPIKETLGRVFVQAVRAIATLALTHPNESLVYKLPTTEHGSVFKLILSSFPADNDFDLLTTGHCGDGWQALHWASVLNEEKVSAEDMSVILRAGTSTALTLTGQCTPVHYLAMALEPNTKKLQLLLSSCPDMAMMADAEDGLTGAHYAAFGSSLEALQQLVIHHPAALEAKDHDGLTILMAIVDQSAYNTSTVSMVRFVMQTNAQCALLTDSRGNTAMHKIYCLWDNDIDNQAFISEMVGVMLESQVGAELVLVRNDCGRLPIHEACMQLRHHSHTFVAQLLKAHPEGARILDKGESLAAHYAADRSSVTVMRMLLEAHPDSVKAISPRFGTLHHSAAQNSLEMIQCVHALCPEGWSTPMPGSERYPLHNACGARLARLDQFCDMIIAVWSLYPEAIRVPDIDGDLPLHVFIASSRFSNKWEQVTLTTDALPCAARPAASPLPYTDLALPCPALPCPALPCPDLLCPALACHRDQASLTTALLFLLKHYPAAAGIPNKAGEPSYHRWYLGHILSRTLAETPYDIAVRLELPDWVRRLLLRAAPSQDPAQLKRLNYAERRGALFLAFSAIVAEPQDISSSSSSSFVVRLRGALMSDAQMSLLRAVVSYI
jgi:ankyrin repeat protein